MTKTLITGRSLRNVLIAVAIVLGALVVAAPPAHADVAVGWYRIRSTSLPGQCMQADPVAAANPSADPLIFVVPCDDSIYQRWLFGSTDPTYPAAYREIRNGAGRCFDADNRGGRLTGKLHLYTCNKSRNQAWAFSEPPSFGVACGYVANLCDWRPGQNLTYTAGKGYRVDYQKTTAGGAVREWLLEPVA
jgi:hypothetical protein